MGLKVGESGLPPAAATGARSTSPTRGASGGIGGTSSSLSSSGGASTKATWTARGVSTLSSIIRWPFSFLYRLVAGSISWTLDKIWGKGRIPANVIEIEVKGWLWGSYIKKVGLDYALINKLITPQDAVAKNYCLPAYLTARGWDIVKFNWKNWRGAEYQYEGKLRSAIRDGYITIEDAIKGGFITKAQAIEGQFLKAEKTPKVSKVASATK